MCDPGSSESQGDKSVIPDRFDKFFKSFINVCNIMEERADREKKLVDRDVKNYLSDGNKAMDEMSKSSRIIREACSMLLTRGDDLKNMSRTVGEVGGEFLDIPHHMQQDTIECLRKVYTTRKADKAICQPHSENAVQRVIRSIEMNVNELENFDSLYSSASLTVSSR